jgi:hypothetical protein
VYRLLLNYLSGRTSCLSWNWLVNNSYLVCGRGSRGNFVIANLSVLRCGNFGSFYDDRLMRCLERSFLYCLCLVLVTHSLFPPVD